MSPSIAGIASLRARSSVIWRADAGKDVTFARGIELAFGDHKSVAAHLLGEVSIGIEQVPGSLVGGFALTIATALMMWQGASWPVATYMALIALISLVAVCLASE